MPTEVAAAGGATSPMHGSSPIGRLTTSAASAAAAFTPGQVLAARYRVIGLLGRGGMGEVYRADDLTLGQPVALKFLPRALAETPGLVDRFRAEVRLARQVSHPNVCRVYDIGEIDGQTFLTMEFVDGEDLGTLLRRIGHLPRVKADEVARQLCAGLAAAHDRSVLHRDLKPSNVMIDGDGRVRITDFGLAIRSDRPTAGEFAGTPAYMAPEQFAGGPLTERSDLYALGLILYEVYTGRRPFDAATLGEWRSRHTESQPTRPGQHGEPVDEATERAILRCLEKDPSQRPASALQLAASLPGGDPVAAALAAGETPSPEMVAASGGEGALSPRAAWLLLAGAALALAGLLMVSRHSTDLGLSVPPRSAAALRERAREILGRYGLDRGAIDDADWFERDYDPMAFVAKRIPSTQWRPAFARWGAPIVYVYRQSPELLWLQNWDGRVSQYEPPPIIPGMAMLTLTGRGELRGLTWNPPGYDSTGAAASGSVDWAGLFHEAGLDLSRFHPVDPRWVPPAAYDSRAEWVGPAPWAPEYELRVSAAAYRGTPCFFGVYGPWTKPLTSHSSGITPTIWMLFNGIFALVTLLMCLGGYLAYRNARLGRGDRRGALRIAGAGLVLQLFSFATHTHYFPAFTPMMWNIINHGVGPGLAIAVFVFSVYLALEPYLRRRMPELLIGWARLIEGRFADARVGREVLIGSLGGLLACLAGHVTSAVTTWVPTLGETAVPPDYDVVYGGVRTLSTLSAGLLVGLEIGLTLFGVLFLLRLLLRNSAAALAGLVLVASVFSLGGENTRVELPAALLTGLACGVCVARGGLLALISLMFVYITLSRVPLPLSSAAPYASASIALIVIVCAMITYAFGRSLGGRSPFGRGFAAELD